LPGIVGIVDYTEEPFLIGMTVNSMLDILNSPSELIKETCIVSNAGFGLVRFNNDSSHKIVEEDENIVLTFWGNLWDKEDLVMGTDKESKVLKNTSAGDMLLSLYKKQGLKSLYNLNGRFVVVTWDKNEKTLKLISDKYGFCKLFYWTSSNRFLFASEYKAIIEHKTFKKKVDIGPIADFMMLGYNLGKRTFFENVKLLPNGSVLTFKNGKVNIERYWNYSFRDGSSPLKEANDYIDGYYEFLEKAIKRQIEGRKVIGLPLSGGLDSRALAGMLKKLNFGVTVKSFSYGNPDCFDVIYGREIAKVLGYEHTYIPIHSTYLMDNAEAFVWLTEGTVNCLNAHMMLPQNFIKKNKIDTIMTGFLGDTVGGESVVGNKPFKELETENNFLRILFRNQTDVISENDIQDFFKNNIYNKIKDETFTTYRSDYMQAPSDNRYFKSIYAELIGRQIRYTSFNIYAFEGLTEVISPYVDNEFVDFALQIPDILAFTRFVQREMIIKYLPIIAAIPWNKTRLPLNASDIRKGLHWRWERLLRNPLVRATIGRKYARMNDDYLKTNEAIRTGSRDFVVKHIKDNPFLAEYFKMDRVHQMLDDHMNRKSNEYGKITALLTLSLWHKLFVEKK
jgi:asparagine synthetase B (glutamine-hydrolysing)